MFVHLFCLYIQDYWLYIIIILDITFDRCKNILIQKLQNNKCTLDNILKLKIFFFQPQIVINSRWERK